MTACNCQSGKEYADCCQPFHLYKIYPETAEQLMRSRYSAYTLVDIPYIVATTLPAQQNLLDQQSMKKWGETTQWAGLNIIKHIPNLSKIHSSVEFKAFFETENGLQTHHENSLFVKVENRWYFVDPTVALPNKKQLCICGSGKKFKHCCGSYI